MRLQSCAVMLITEVPILPTVGHVARLSPDREARWPQDGLLRHTCRMDRLRLVTSSNEEAGAIRLRL